MPNLDGALLSDFGLRAQRRQAGNEQEVKITNDLQQVTAKREESVESSKALKC